MHTIGNPARYWEFFRQFEVYVESKVKDPGQGLLYVTHCWRYVKEVIEEVRKILADLFGQPHIIAWSLHKGLFNQAQQTSHMEKSLSDKDGLGTRRQANEFMTDLHFRSVLERIDRQNQWAEVTERISRVCRDANFVDLTEFFETRSRIAISRSGQLVREGEAHPHKNSSNTNMQHQKREGPTLSQPFLMPLQALSFVLCALKHSKWQVVHVYVP
ncbi:unnamed protein product [Schistocephalus solidus]|uniref:CRAL-TRIO domain-containing protein n=1 Tax=Schistocephalus solidus TaxID=70667 RepID=A0A183SMS7_SCHSO|nr:unnamed protein product [Schistocephalus solidus]